MDDTEKPELNFWQEYPSKIREKKHSIQFGSRENN
jgi:hypothetical protein